MTVRDLVISAVRRLKPAWTLYNLAHWRRLRRNAEHYRKLAAQHRAAH